MSVGKVHSSLTNISENLKPKVSVGESQPHVFKRVLEESLKIKKGSVSDKPQTGVSKNLKFSRHAIDRMFQRGLSFSSEMLSRISDAVSKAKSKGSKETLVLTDQAALVVSVKDNTVVTVMDKAMLKENVFTNIDSTVIL
ncbi:MAG: hypothetical protein D6797_05990 [Bdellovibrio sp.]|nr:MAG: hypothetical protein D6797_05990 [Bdellovibrio sp.]